MFAHALAFLNKGEVRKLRAQFMMYSLICGLLRKEITNRLDLPQGGSENKPTVVAAAERNALKVNDPTNLTVLCCLA